MPSLVYGFLRPTELAAFGQGFERPPINEGIFNATQDMACLLMWILLGSLVLVVKSSPSLSSSSNDFLRNGLDNSFLTSSSSTISPSF